jgi:hypothetical protein
MTLIITNARDLFFTSAEEYQAWRDAHRQKARNKMLTAEDCAIFALLTGRDLYKAFSPSKKLVANGQPPYATLARVLDNLSRFNRREALERPTTPVMRLTGYLNKSPWVAPGRREQIENGQGAMGLNSVLALSTAGAL